MYLLKVLFVQIVILTFVSGRTESSKSNIREKKQISDVKVNESPSVGNTNHVSSQNGTRKNKLVANDDSFSASLLLDIRDLLTKKDEETNELFMQRNEQLRLENLAQQSQSSIESLTDDIEKYQQFTDDKVNLVLETFSTLKLLVVSQGNTLKDTLERLEQLELKADSLTSKFNGLQSTTNEQKNEQEGAASVTLSTSDSMVKIDSIARSVDELQQEVYNLKSNVTELIAVSQDLTVQDKMTTARPIITQNQGCNCDLEDITNSIEALDKDQQEQKNAMEELVYNLTSMQERRYQEQLDSTFRNRLGEVEGTLKDLNTVRRDVSTVKNSLNHLKEELNIRSESQVGFVSNSTRQVINNKGLCVWPYTRCGNGCYSVLMNKRLNWMAARDYCKSIQGDLASPNSFDDFKLFIRHQRLSRAYTYWIGASDIESEGTWNWVDGRPLSNNATIWSSGHPIDDQSSNCLAFKPNNRYELVASDEECRVSRYFICQQERLV